MLKKILQRFIRSFWGSQPWEFIQRPEEEEDSNISLGDNVIDKSHGLPFIQHDNQNDVTRLPSYNKTCKAIPNLKSQSYYTLHFIRVTELQYLTFYSKKVFISICFQKQKGRQIKPGIFYAFVDIVNPSILDVIGRLNTT